MLQQVQNEQRLVKDQNSALEGVVAKLEETNQKLKEQVENLEEQLSKLSLELIQERKKARVIETVGKEIQTTWTNPDQNEVQVLKKKMNILEGELSSQMKTNEQISA